MVFLKLIWKQARYSKLAEATLAFTTFTVLSIAHGAGPSFDSCAVQIPQLCPAEVTPGDIIQCLRKNHEQLSVACKEEIERVARGLDQAGEQGGRSLSVLGGLSSTAPPFPVIAYEGIFNHGSPGTAEHRLNLSSPIFQSAGDYWALSLAGAQVHVDRPLNLAPGFDEPTDFYRTEIGTQFTHRLPEHQSWGVRGSLGYATDHFSGRLSDTIFNLSLQYGRPGRGGYWTYFLFISNNSPLGNYVPLPGFMYLYKSDGFSAAIGFPLLSLQWTPRPEWAYSLSMFGPALTAEAAHGAIQSLQVFTALNWNNQSFVLENRQDEKDRLTLEDKKAAVGVRSFVFDRMQLEAKAGYAFDRQMYVGNGFRNMRRGSAGMDSDWFAACSVKSAF